MRIASSAPTRIDLAGGTIDIWPLYLYHERAQTLNVAINLRAACRIEPRTDSRVVVHSADTGDTLDVSHWSELRDTAELRLLGRGLHFFRASGLSLTTSCQSPAGAGLGGSSALNVAVCAALARWTGASYSGEELLTIALNVEAQAIDVPTGGQDYRPALYGGLSALEFRVDGVRRVPLSVAPEELERRIVLAYTGASRSSGTNNWEILKRHLDGDRHTYECFEKIRDAAEGAREALIERNWEEVGRQIAAEWKARKRLAPGVTTPAIDDLMARAHAVGARATKVCGAGGGGCLFGYADPSVLPAVRQALAQGGATILDYRVDTEGLHIECRDDDG